jgi:MFS family permease
MEHAESPSANNHSLLFLVILSTPALSLATVFAVNNPALYHFVLTRFADNGIINGGRLNTALGLIAIFGLAISAIAHPLIGSFSDRTESRLGRRYPIMFAGACCLLFGLLLQINANSVLLLMVAVFATQSILAMIQSPLQALIPDQVTINQMGLASGIKTVLELVGIMLGGILVFLFLGDRNIPNLAAITLSILMIGSVLVIIWKQKEPTTTQQYSVTISAQLRYIRLYHNGKTTQWWIHMRYFSQSLRHVFRRRDFVWWLLHRVCFFTCFSILSKFAITYLEDVFGLSEADAREMQGELQVILGGAVILITIPAGILSDRIGRIRLVGLAGVLAAIMMVILSQTRSLTVAVLLLAVIGVATAIFFSVGWALVTSIVPQRHAAFYLGITSIATNVGSAVGLSGGVLIDEINKQTESTLGYSVILIIGAVLFLVAGLAVQRIQEQVPQLPSQFEHEVSVA